MYLFKEKLLSLPASVERTHTNTERPEQMNVCQLLCSMEVTANIITSSTWLLLKENLPIIFLKVKMDSEPLNSKYKTQQVNVTKTTPTGPTLVKRSSRL
jgi:hypothetical protein